ncbi:uncharacterized protein LOC130903716 [Diorhabda carinulata]|uniref:uncharacterized protein LOC130903716 n=1 Tax=Diorhabda carinulata TaxID=1163345 RepID=UPI0025A1AD31|nr:uncharacterized protein LOC130903716 [Diorhabda carinulata]
MILLVVNDIENFMEALHFMTITITVLSKISRLFMAAKDMKDIENYLANFETSKIPHGIVGYVIDEAYFRDRFYLPQWTLITFLTLLQLATCLIFHTQRLVFIVSWFPFDLQKPEFYFPTVIFQIIVLIFNAFPNIAIDTTYYVLVDIACCELDILMYKLTNLDPSKNTNDTIKELKEDVICHQTILRFILCVQNNVFAGLMFLQCIGSIITICVLGFQFTTTVLMLRYVINKIVREISPCL